MIGVVKQSNTQAVGMLPLCQRAVGEMEAVLLGVAARVLTPTVIPA